MRLQALFEPAVEDRLTARVFLRALGAVYLVAFLAAAFQLPALVGERGLLPAGLFLDRVAEASGPFRFFRLPTLFWLGSSDAALQAAAWAGAALAAAAVLGLGCAPLFAGLWVLYQSVVQVGQLFYGYGWETLLLESGFLAIFLAPPLRPDPAAAPPRLGLWLLRWVLFRVMFGAGLIKLRGDECWRDLSCLVYHYETQPIPNPLSWYFHQLPEGAHKLGTAFTHVVELAVPWALFGPRRARAAAGLLFAGFQGMLLLSGNLSWLNWLTLALCVPCFDDGAWSRLLGSPTRAAPRFGPARRGTLALLGLAVGVLSLPPALNLLSPRQAMNRSYDPLHLVNTYGAFGTVGRRRYEVVLLGTSDPAGPESGWKELEFKCKPGDPRRRPCWLSPYHLRLDWQIWFAAMQEPSQNPWLVHWVSKLLAGEPAAWALLDGAPPAAPPRAIRADWFEYRFAGWGEEAWWERERVASYLPPLTLGNPSLAAFLAAHGWGPAATGTGPAPPGSGSGRR